MGVKVLEAEDADMERIFTIASLAFAGNEPMWDIMWVSTVEYNPSYV